MNGRTRRPITKLNEVGQAIKQFASGATKEVKIVRADLIPVLPQWWLAVLYGRGAIKYGEFNVNGNSELVESCTCGQQTATQIALITLEDTAATAMNASFAALTQSLQNDNDSNRRHGSERTVNAKELLILRIAKAMQQRNEEPSGPSTEDGLFEDYLRRLASDFLMNRVRSALSVETSSEPEVPILITTIAQGLHEDFFAHAATKAWASSETRPKVFGEHSSTCAIHRLTVTPQGFLNPNKRNWELGYDWSMSVASIEHHLWQFRNGEDWDEEMQVPHPVCIAWHAFALTQFMLDPERYAQFDDRPQSIPLPDLSQMPPMLQAILDRQAQEEA